MKIAAWRTGHEIADTVAESLVRGILNAEIKDTRFDKIDSGEFGIHIAYGILRGAAYIFKKADNWYNADRGYFKPSHYDGYYRISHKGTQQTKFWPEPDYDRWNALGFDMQSWRGFDHSKPALVCPPTDAVVNFFGPWLQAMPLGNYLLRPKGDTSPINFSDYNYILTFNSSVGWQALLAGIPCVSDTTNSMVGSWYHNISLENLEEAQYVDRERLFATMSSLQFTLKEIEQGAAWDLISTLVSTAVNPSPPTWRHTPLENVHAPIQK